MIWLVPIRPSSTFQSFQYTYSSFSENNVSLFRLYNTIPIAKVVKIAIPKLIATTSSTFSLVNSILDTTMEQIAPILPILDRNDVKDEILSTDTIVENITLQ